MPKNLVLIGAGHAHMVTLANIHSIVAKGHKVTVIGPSKHHYYSGMGPGMLSRIYSPDDIRFATKHVVTKQGGTFLICKIGTFIESRKTVVISGIDDFNIVNILFNGIP